MNKIYFSSLQELKKNLFITKWFNEIKDEIGGIYDGSNFFFYSSICPHFGGDFKYCKHTKKLRCNWHGWQFDITNGKSITNFNSYEKKSIFNRILRLNRKIEIGCFPYKGSLKKYDHIIDNQDIFILHEDN